MEVDKRLNISLDHYIEDEYSVCREERQYALFLCNVLKKYGGENYKQNKEAFGGYLETIFDVCSIPEDAVIVNVFYEATFMRDIFTRSRRIGEWINRNTSNRQKRKVDDAVLSKDYSVSVCGYEENSKYEGTEYTSFNKKLLEYLGVSDDKIAKVNERNIGHNILEDVFQTDNEFSLNSEDRKKLKIAQYMMNSKPDLAVIYSSKSEDKRSQNEEGTYYLLFLECKFESGEDKMELDADEPICQTDIQYKIAEFICTYYGYSQEKKLAVAKLMADEKKSVKVEFTRRENEKKICINKLIEMNEAIFQ